MVADMVCNFKRCRKPLVNTAWVTSCSHAFCAEHGENEFVKRSQEVFICPACNSKLDDKFDVVQTDLHPSEPFKSIVLAGMKPDTVMDIAMRAISFWSYQMEEETRYQENVGKHAREKVRNLEEFHSLNLQRVQVEVQSNKKKVESLQSECNKYKRQSEEYAAILEEKNRKLQRLQFQLESQRRNSIHINDEETKESCKRQNLGNLITNRRSTTPKFRFQPKITKNKHFDECSMTNDTPMSYQNNSFTFNPVTPSQGIVRCRQV